MYVCVRVCVLLLPCRAFVSAAPLPRAGHGVEAQARHHRRPLQEAAGRGRPCTTSCRPRRRLACHPHRGHCRLYTVAGYPVPFQNCTSGKHLGVDDYITLSCFRPGRHYLTRAPMPAAASASSCVYLSSATTLTRCWWTLDRTCSSSVCCDTKNRAHGVQ